MIALIVITSLVLIVYLQLNYNKIADKPKKILNVVITLLIQWLMIYIMYKIVCISIDINCSLITVTVYWLVIEFFEFLIIKYFKARSARKNKK
jgi:CDP-diglyceride synthetase